MSINVFNKDVWRFSILNFAFYSYVINIKVLCGYQGILKTFILAEQMFLLMDIAE